MLTYLKGVLARAKALFSKPPRKPKLAVIDDAGFIRRGVVRDFSDTYEVTEFARIPPVLDELDEFDVLIVDGDGIGNETWRHGADFLCDYIPLRPGKRYVHFSGLIDRFNRNRLTVLGCKCVTKGSRPDELINAVNGTKEG